MAILSGALTVRRFRVVGDVPEGYREIYRDRLDEYAFKERPIEQGKEEQEGWVQVHNLLDNTFTDMNKWLYNNYAVFALRVDKKSLPAKLFNATVAKKAEKWCLEHGTERCPTTIKRQIKEELEEEWLKRTLPRVATTECCWNITEQYLLLHSLSEGSADRFRKRFFQTFAMKLVPWSPLDWIESQGSVEDLIATGPANLHGEAA